MNAHTSWKTYCDAELTLLTPVLMRHGFTLDTEQPHLAGERYLMQAVTTTSGKKLILLGKGVDGTRVVIKATRDAHGIRELAHEQVCRDVLKKIDFAGAVFHTPALITHIAQDGFVVMVSQFIPQQSTFLERPLDEQFSLALRAFKGQESAHATTFTHRALIADTFGIRDAKTYLTLFEEFTRNVSSVLENKEVGARMLTQAHTVLCEHERIIEQYCGFLTHTDFVPHNFRITDDTIYLLDHSSLTFGNKYEGWARFLNFMALYNPPLERALVQYVKDNRTREESVSLRMMRIFRLGEILWYYTKTLDKSTGNLLLLNHARITFWSTVLTHIINDEPVPATVVEEYKKTRDSLRSEDEKKRQVGLH